MAKPTVTVLFQADDVNLLPAGERRKRERQRIPLRKRRRERRAVPDRVQLLQALQSKGFDAKLFELRDEASLLELAHARADLFFNTVESFGGDDGKEPHVAAFLELFEKRYTGSPPQAMQLAQDKAVAKKIFDFHGIHTPRFAVAVRGAPIDVGHLELPLIVKPVSEDGSVGIDKDAVVKTLGDLLARIEFVHGKFDCPALVEEYVEGREIYAAVLGNGGAGFAGDGRSPKGGASSGGAGFAGDGRSPKGGASNGGAGFAGDGRSPKGGASNGGAGFAGDGRSPKGGASNRGPTALPLVEIDLSGLPEGMPRIAGAEVKWEKGSPAYESTRSAAAGALEGDTGFRLQQTALEVYAALGLRDYGRVDMRLCSDGRIYVIEANPNPWLAQEAELAIAAGLAGRSYPDLIAEIVDLALSRYA